MSQNWQESGKKGMKILSTWPFSCACEPDTINKKGIMYQFAIEREPVVDYPTSLWSDYPTDYPISDTRPPVVPSVG